MLVVSIVISFLNDVYGTRLLLGFWVNSGFLKNRKTWFGVKEEEIRDITDTTEEEPTLFNKHVNFVKHRKKIFTFSTAIIVLGVISLVTFKLNPGVDFTSGSRVEIVANEALSTEEVEKDLDHLGLEPKTIVISGNNNEIAVSRYDVVLSEEKEAEMNEYFLDKYGHEPSISVVSSIVGRELIKNALYALGIAAIGMIIYVTFRFEFYFAITAIIALLHDTFIMLFVFSVTRIEFDVTIIAAVLTIIGYSIYNTIVVFDRIRENIRIEKKVSSFDKLALIINRSLIQTFTRSMNTALTTMIAVLSFLILGSQSISGFAIALIVGLVFGTYSSLFLASQLWLVFRGKNIKERPVDFTKAKRVDGPQV